MTKSDKYKEKEKPKPFKVLENVTKLKLTIMFTAIGGANEKGYKRADWLRKKDLYYALIEGAEKREGGFIFSDRPNLKLPIRDYEILIKDLEETSYANIEYAKVSDELIIGWESCETIKPDEIQTEEIETEQN